MLTTTKKDVIIILSRGKPIDNNQYVEGKRSIEGKGGHMEEMTEKEQATLLIDEYTKLQRIKSATDKEKEIEYQLKTTKAKLEALGIIAENLDIE